MDNKSKKYNDEMAYLVDKNRNTVHRFYAKEKADVLYNKFSENLLWIVTKENKLAVFPPEKFKGIDKNNIDYTFVMDLHDEAIASEDDVRKFYNFDRPSFCHHIRISTSYDLILDFSKSS